MLDDIKRSGGKDYMSVGRLDSLINGDFGFIDNQSKIEILESQLNAYFSLGAYGKASYVYDKMRELDIEESEYRPSLQNQINIGISLLYSGRYVDAYALAYGIAKQARNSGNIIKEADAFLLLANISIRTGEIEEAAHCLDKVNQLLKGLKDSEEKKVIYFRYLLGKSALEITKSNYKEAYEYIKKAEMTGVQPEMMPYALNINIAIVYEFLGNIGGAEKYYKQIADSPRLHYNKCVAMNNYAGFLIRHNREKEAVAYLLENLEILETMGAKHAKAHSLSLLADAYSKIGDFKQATDNATAALSLYDEVMMEYYQSQHANISSLYENEVLKYEVDQRGAYIKKLLVGLVAIQLIYLLYVAFLTIASRNIRMISQKKLNVHMDYMYDNEINKLRISALEEIINHKNRELVAYRLKMDQYSETFHELSKTAQDIKEDKPVSLVLDKLKALNMSKSNWNELKLYFEEIHPGFYTSLESLHPNLTRGEKRMCAFIITGMSTPEIADICNRSPRTVESVKYQLKKKLGLGPDESLDKYLMGIKSSPQ